MSLSLVLGQHGVTYPSTSDASCLKLTILGVDFSWVRRNIQIQGDLENLQDLSTVFLLPAGRWVGALLSQQVFWEAATARNCLSTHTRKCALHPCTKLYFGAWVSASGWVRRPAYGCWRTGSLGLFRGPLCRVGSQPAVLKTGGGRSECMNTIRSKTICRQPWY